MFMLTTIQDVIQIPPDKMDLKHRDVIEDQINAKYANKVIQKVGWCVCFYDLLSATDGLIGHGTGIVNVNVTFRMLILRPFRGEILEAKIAETTSTHIRLSVDFFDDIIVKCPEQLFAPSAYSAAEAVWVWRDLDDAGAATEYYFDKHERVRVRVEDEVWSDQAPSGPMEVAEGGESVGEREERKKDLSPYRIMGSMNSGGLGCLRWWMGGEEEEEEEAADEEAGEE